jgi:hypothetical protein
VAEVVLQAQTRIAADSISAKAKLTVVAERLLDRGD